MTMTKTSKRLATVDTRHPDWHPDLDTYDRIIVAFSGGKDSQACVLRLLDLGVHPAKIELWHHDVDGREGSTLMDWACTRAYCERFAEAFGLRLLFSWKVGGFEGEMLREDSRTAPIAWEEPDGEGGVVVRQAGGDRGKLSTRLRYPQVAADLRVRWCSAYLKIDVGDRVFRRDPRFNQGGRFLILTGERAQESAARSKYEVFEIDRADNRKGKRAPRHIDHWRPVHAWSEERVWEIIERYRVQPHPAYRLGWGRVSCRACIFGSPDQWASLRTIDPQGFERIAEYERQFGRTIHRKRSVGESADKGEAYDETAQTDLVAEATDHDWNHPVILEPGEWTLPAGAYGDSAGPV
jgi:3'-phosphoadenosine 5'-phosphosulfate sulfotransferase (PAPS reductase)/FAD synthetase